MVRLSAQVQAVHTQYTINGHEDRTREAGAAMVVNSASSPGMGAKGSTNIVELGMLSLESFIPG